MTSRSEIARTLAVAEVRILFFTTREGDVMLRVDSEDGRIYVHWPDGTWDSPELDDVLMSAVDTLKG